MWFLYALLGAIGKSYSGFFRKKIAKNISSSMFMWLSYTLTLLIMTPFMLDQMSAVTDSLIKFPVAVIGSTLSIMIATQLNLEALRREDLSYTAPLNSFVPVFTLGIASVFLHEHPPRFGVMGIIIVVIGAYIVNIRPGKIRWHDPLKRLFVSVGAQLSLGVAFGYAVNTVFMKVLTNHGYNAYVVLYVTTLLAWLLLIYVPLTKRHELRAVGKTDKLAVLGGAVSSFAGGLFHILAIAHTFTSYAVSVRRLDAVISVLLGWRFLKESNIRIKLIGSLVMTAGAVIMAIS